MTALDRHAGPIPVTRLDQADPILLEELLEVVGRVARAGAFTMGAELEAFEAEFAAYCGAPHSVGVSSGTEAISLALRALEIGPGDEVIVPTNSFIATAEAVSWVGATVKPVDVDPETHLITAEAVAEAIGPRTRCVIPVHLMGSTVDIDAILEVARPAGLRVIEDTAQAHGADVRGRRAGSLGDLGCFSFYPTKNLGAWGDGGAITTADAELADRVRLLRSHGEKPRYHHRIVGTTARLDALQAAILRVKLRHLEGWNEARRERAAGYDLLLADVEGVDPLALADGAVSSRHQYVVTVPERDAALDALAERGIGAGVHYPVPLHRQPALEERMGDVSLPNSEWLADHVLSLPIFPELTPEQQEQVVAALAEHLEQAGASSAALGA